MSLFHAEATGSYVDVQAVAQMEASFWSSAVKWNLRQRGIRIHFSQQPDIEYRLVDEEEDPANEENTDEDETINSNYQDNDTEEDNILHDRADKRRDFWLWYQEFSAKAEGIINLALASLRHTLYSTCTPDFAEVHAVDEEILNPIAQSVGNSLVHWLLTSRNQGADPEDNIDLLKYVSSQKHAPQATQLETMEIQSIIIAIVFQVHEYLIKCHHYRTTGETQRHGVPIEQLVECLDPPVTDRLKLAFPDTDPELVESVATTFTEDLWGYFIDFLIGTESSKRLEVTLVTILAARAVHILDSDSLREDTQDLQYSANVMIDTILAELRESLYHKSFLSSGDIGLIANLGPQIHETLHEGFPEIYRW